jgi:hypothetical protein
MAEANRRPPADQRRRAPSRPTDITDDSPVIRWVQPINAPVAGERDGVDTDALRPLSRSQEDVVDPPIDELSELRWRVRVRRAEGRGGRVAAAPRPCVDECMPERPQHLAVTRGVEVPRDHHGQRAVAPRVGGDGGKCCCLRATVFEERWLPLEAGGHHPKRTARMCDLCDEGDRPRLPVRRGKDGRLDTDDGPPAQHAHAQVNADVVPAFRGIRRRWQRWRREGCVEPQGGADLVRLSCVIGTPHLLEADEIRIERTKRVEDERLSIAPATAEPPPEVPCDDPSTHRACVPDVG